MDSQLQLWGAVEDPYPCRSLNRAWVRVRVLGALSRDEQRSMLRPIMVELARRDDVWEVRRFDLERVPGAFCLRFEVAVSMDRAAFDAMLRQVWPSADWRVSWVSARGARVAG